MIVSLLAFQKYIVLLWFKSFLIFHFFLCRNCLCRHSKRSKDLCDEVHVNVAEFFWGIHQPSNELPLKKWQHLRRFCIHVKSPSLGGRLPLFYPISLLNIHLPPRSGNLPLFEPHFLPIIKSLKRVNFIEFLQWKCIAKSAKYPQITIIKCYASYEEF